MGLLRLLGIGDRDLPGDAAAPVREQMLASLLVMAWVVEARDPYTGGHLWRVSRFSELLARHAGLSAHETAYIAVGGFLHDLGKVAIPDAILRKPGRLSGDEYAVIKTHPEVGYRMLAGHPLERLAADAIRLHHETPDGRGYPDGLTGAEIPRVARIVGVCDAFDALTSSRPYRSGMPVEQALAIIREDIGRQFDGEYGELLLKLGNDGALLHIVGHSDVGIPLECCAMCGPTLVLRRTSRAGDSLFCRNCGGEYRLEAGDGGHLKAVPTGAKGSAAELKPEADRELVARFVHETAKRALPLAA